MEKKPFVTKEQVEEIVKKYPTPFHIYDEESTDAEQTAHQKQNLCSQKQSDAKVRR